MLVVHTAEYLSPRPGLVLPGGAVAVDGARIAAVGTAEELTARYPAARLRRWPGVLTSGLVNACGPELLEAAYHPDPREAAELGTEPLAGAALAALEMTGARWGAGARRGLQRMLSCGTTAVAGPFTRPAVRTAVARSGLQVLPRMQPPPGPPSPDPLERAPLDAVRCAPLAAGGRADLAVFAVRPAGAGSGQAAAAGAGAAGAGGGGEGPAVGPASCLAVVLAGRLVFRRA